MAFSGSVSGRAASASGAIPGAMTITGSELDRMRRLVASAGSPAEEAALTLRDTRRSSSLARSSRWPNTLEALRRRKLEARAERLAEKEAAAVALDEEEELRRMEARAEALRRAREAIEASSEKMRALKGYRKVSHDADVNAAQAALKAERARLEAEAEAQDAAALKLSLITPELGAEEREAAERRARAIELSASHKGMMRRTLASRSADLEADAEAGRRLAAAAAEFKEEQRQLAAAARAAGQRRAAELASMMAEHAESKRAAALEDTAIRSFCETQVAAGDARRAKIDAIRTRKRADAVAKGEIIGTVTARNFAAKESDIEARAERDAAARVAREDAVTEAKAAARAAAIRDMSASIAAMKRRAIAEIRAVKDEEAADAERFRERVAVLEAEERAQAEARRARARELQGLQRAQAADKKRGIEAWGTLDREEAVSSLREVREGSLEGSYHLAATRVLGEEDGRGHTTQPLRRLLHKLENPALKSSVGWR